MKFSENLRNLRKKNEYSQEYLAEKMNVSRQTISKWENGTAMPDLKRLTELAELFDVSLDEFLEISALPSRSESTEAVQACAYEIAQEQISACESQHKKEKTILSVSIILLTIAIIITNISLYSTIESLRSTVDEISNQQNNMLYNVDDSAESIADDVEMQVTSVDENSPWLYDLEFAYTPKTYIKGTRVTIRVRDYASSQSEPEEYIAQNNGNGFVAVARLNALSVYDIKLVVDDGTNVTTEELSIDDWIYNYCGFENTRLCYSVDSMYFENDGSGGVCWKEDANLPKITRAKLVAEKSGNAVFTQELKISKRDYEYAVECPHSFKTDTAAEDIFIVLKDEYSTTYKIPVTVYANESEQTIDLSDDNISVIFKNGKTAIASRYQ